MCGVKPRGVKDVRRDRIPSVLTPALDMTDHHQEQNLEGKAGYVGVVEGNLCNRQPLLMSGREDAATSCGCLVVGKTLET